MKASLDNAFLFKVMMFFLGIIIALLVGSLSYSKTYRVKNSILEILEKHKKYNTAAKVEIEATLREIGYKTNPRGTSRCPEREDGELIDPHGYNFRYCIYKHNSSKGYFYTVVVFMYFEIPVIGDYLEFPVSGQTIVIYDL